jgi:hypothetical protein
MPAGGVRIQEMKCARPSLLGDILGGRVGGGYANGAPL